MIPYGKQSIDSDDIQAVINVLQSDYLTQGPLIEKFESQIADYCGAKYCSAISNATSALHLACLALEIGPKDIVWTSPISFVASANCALYCQATIDFVDINFYDNNICISALKEKLYFAKLNNRLPKAIIAVHMSGLSCDMKSIHKLSIEYGFKIIEDASHALGGDYNKNKIGATEYSDVCIFSLHPVKMITTGEGGLILTNNIKIKKMIDLLRSHGITKLQSDFFYQPEGEWHYEQQLLGYNYRMTDIQAGLGISQLKKLNKFIKIRRDIAHQYNLLFSKHQELIVPPLTENIEISSNHLYIVKVNPKVRNIAFKKLRKSGIFCQLHYIPIYRHPYYAKLLPANFSLVNAENYYASAISLPIFPDLSTSEIRYVADEFIQCLKNM